MSALHPGNLHGQGARSKTRYQYVRQRAQETQKVKEDVDTPKKEDPAPTPSGSNSTVIFVLVLMIGVTWGIAATSYFEVVDYRSLIDQCSAFFNEDPFPIIDKRRPVSVVPPSRRLKQSLNLVTKDSMDTTAEPVKHPDIPQEKRDVDSGKKPEPAKTKQTEQKPAAEKKQKPDTSVKHKDEDKPSAAKDSEEKPKVVDERHEADKVKGSTKKQKPKSITSNEDKPILEKLKEGEKLLTQKKHERAWNFFKHLANDYPKSPRALFGRARAEAMVAEHQRSNPMLVQAINTYDEVASMADCPKELQKRSLMAKSEKEMFLGRMKPALDTQLRLAKMHPKDIEVLNKLGVRYLMLGQNPAARKVYDKVLQVDPNDGFALVHMGFILKNAGDWAGSIDYLMRGVESDEPGTQEGKFYFHLGDALHRTNRTEEADKIYEKAANRGLFRSKYQRSLYNVDRLKGQPFWTPEEAGVKDYVRRLEMNWKVIRDEGLAVMDQETGLFLHEEESLKDTGEWRQFTMFQRGVRNEANCRRTPKTCSIIERMPDAKSCKRGQVKYSVMMPGTHVWPHTGPTNCRLRMHLGLVIPKTGSGARLACAGEMKTWEEGKVLIFDDSFVHEVWQEAESFRLILIIDVWHPDLTEQEKKTLSPI